MSTNGQDLRYPIQVLAKSPWLATGAVSMLALGLGAKTAIFNMLCGVPQRPRPFREADPFYGVTLNSDGEFRETALTFDDIRSIKQRSQWYELVCASTPVGLDLCAEGTAERVCALHVIFEYFMVPDEQPFHERDFPTEDVLLLVPEEGSTFATAAGAAAFLCA